MDELSSPATGVETKEEVKSPVGVLPEPVSNESQPRSPWISGSFYLLVGVVTCVLVLVIAAHVPWYAVPIVVLATLSFSAVIGALQLRHDERLTESSFLRLVARSTRLRSLHGKRQPQQSQEDDRHPSE